MLVSISTSKDLCTNERNTQKENNFEENSCGNNDKKKTFDKNKLIDKHRK